MSVIERKPFHEVLAQFLAEEDFGKYTGLSAVRYFAERAIIPDGHDAIAKAAGMQKGRISRLDGDAINDLCTIESAARNEQRRVQAQKAEEANKATDADKVAALVAVINKMLKHIPPGLVGEQAVAMGRFFLRFQELSGRAQRAKTIQEIQQVLTELK